MKQSLDAIIEIVRELATQLVSRAGSGRLSPNSAMASAAKFEPLLARTLRDSLLASWLTAARDAVRGASSESGPGSAARSATSPPVSPSPGLSLPPLRPPFGPPGFGSSPEPEPVVRLPIIEQAAKDLASRGVFTPDDFARLDQDARRAAFTVARSTSLDTVAKVRDALAENTRDGGTLKDFRNRLEQSLNSGSAAISPSAMETTYRTQQAQAYSAGQRAVLSDPYVSDAFPYFMWSATHDSRVRPDHLKMETFGQNGTAVYRVDDPIWETLYPPAGYNCRCVLIPLSIEDAARLGSAEALRWLQTGEPPTNPDWVRPPYPIELPRGWPTHQRIQSVV